MEDIENGVDNVGEKKSNPSNGQHNCNVITGDMLFHTININQF